MSVPTGTGNYPPGVTDADPHFDGEPAAGPGEPCELCGAPAGEPCAPSCHTQTDSGEAANDDKYEREPPPGRYWVTWPELAADDAGIPIDGEF
jgi:hypothetical protein